MRVNLMSEDLSVNNIVMSQVNFKQELRQTVFPLLLSIPYLSKGIDTRLLNTKMRNPIV